MYATAQGIRNVTFLVLVSLVTVFLTLFILNKRLGGLPFAVAVALPIAFAILGVSLVVLTLRLREPWYQKTCFALAGASAAGMPIFAVLHNVVYGLFIRRFGQGFWEQHGSDEPVFFILAVLVCPALFVISAVGGVVLLLIPTRHARVR